MLRNAFLFTKQHKPLIYTSNLIQISKYSAEKQKTDYYEILKISRSATQKEVKDSYFKLAKMYHPDSSNENSKTANMEQFNLISEAYQILSKENLRKKYDQYGHTLNEQDDVDDFDYEDIFRQTKAYYKKFKFGERRKERTRIGDHVTINVCLSFMEAVLGCTRTIEYDSKNACVQCEGSGSNTKTHPIICQECKGRGESEIPKRARDWLKIEDNKKYVLCLKCAGDGVIIQNPCVACGGQSLIKKSRKIDIIIPPGTQEGSTLVMKGQGDAGIYGGTMGSLFINISVADHEHFSREGRSSDVISTEKIDFLQAALGGIIKVDCIHGKYEVDLPAGCQHDESIILNGLGTNDLVTGERGDHILKLNVLIPTNFTKQQIKVLKRYQVLEQEQNEQKHEENPTQQEPQPQPQQEQEHQQQPQQEQEHQQQPQQPQPQPQPQQTSQQTPQQTPQQLQQQGYI